MVTQELKNHLNKWGNYNEQENCIYLYDNTSLQDSSLINILKECKIKIQLNLFT